MHEHTTIQAIEVTEILGTLNDKRFADRRHDRVDIGWGDARKHRQILTTANGGVVKLQLPRGTFLRDGDVLADDGDTVVVVRRTAEPAIAVDFSANGGSDGARRMLLLGYLLGNQHAPLQVTTDRVVTPLMTSASTAAETLAALHVHGHVTDVPLAPHGWSNTSADHHHHHD
ncbi:urease accessory protein UreE [Gordonia sp. Z-3]|uniref:urease accessory protein UreE n=1 Tax=Gordonia sp. Z-3 TaxID=3115408 RepID=UPI002E2944A2|nr:urease accessory protein UreE [Gordonia sp. Z-3]MED5803102.1 urease accessory protein UreE [Gordonia sp. Z-3]